MNLSNALTFFRIALLIPMGIFLHLDWCLSATFVLILAGISDGLDGYFARKWNQITDFGKLMDPIADKIFVSVAFFLLVADPSRHLNPWLASILVAREFFVSGLRSLFANRGIILAAEKSAKWKTVFQFIGIGGYILKTPLFKYFPDPIFVGNLALIISLVLSYVSMGHYIKKYKTFLIVLTITITSFAWADLTINGGNLDSATCISKDSSKSDLNFKIKWVGDVVATGTDPYLVSISMTYPQKYARSFTAYSDVDTGDGSFNMTTSYINEHQIDNDFFHARILDGSIPNGQKVATVQLDNIQINRLAYIPNSRSLNLIPIVSFDTLSDPMECSLVARDSP